jgi:hypothetical protein
MFDYLAIQLEVITHMCCGFFVKSIKLQGDGSTFLTRHE